LTFINLKRIPSTAAFNRGRTGTESPTFSLDSRAAGQPDHSSPNPGANRRILDIGLAKSVSNSAFARVGAAAATLRLRH
jgi:hypothetical protein